MMSTRKCPGCDQDCILVFSYKDECRVLCDPEEIEILHRATGLMATGFRKHHCPPQEKTAGTLEQGSGA